MLQDMRHSRRLPSALMSDILRVRLSVCAVTSPP